MYSGDECIDGDRMMIEVEFNQFGSNAGCLSFDVGCSVCGVSFGERYVDTVDGCEELEVEFGGQRR